MTQFKLKTLLKILLQRRSAFTLIELLVTISLVAIIAVASTLSLSGYRGEQNLKRTLDEISSVIQDAQKRAITQQDGLQWGVHFQNSSSIHAYEMFEGASYAVGTSTNHYGLPRGIQFSNPFSSSTYDAIFTGITGNLSGKKVISFITGRRDNFVGDIILNTLGKATPRFDSGLIGYWHLDEGTGTSTYDASGSGNTGTLTNNPTWQTSTNCEADGCLSFDGVNQYVSASGVPNLTSALTVEAWAKTPIVQDATYDTIVSKFSSGPYNGWFLRRNANSSVVYFTLYDNGTATASITGPTIVANQWTHYAATFDGTIARIYVNGVLSASDLSASIGSATTNFVISGNYGSTENWNGSIDEVRIYNRALSATEILNQYNDLK
ncbi:MAG: LamG-like jellyroll fold domain-containing protein [Candidatus Paceibacterota bacterium]|jgi:prepilin-type N-terminal cleavage/methylation domain-containing protein